MRLATKATHQQTRAINQGLVLRTIYDFGPISRAEVARLSGLTRTTVGDVISELETEASLGRLDPPKFIPLSVVLFWSAPSPRTE